MLQPPVLCGLIAIFIATLPNCSSRRYAAAPKVLPNNHSLMVLDGELTFAKWDDGDTFSVKPATKGRRIRARLKGYNTLESYGPVHHWGEWTGQELYHIAKQATHLARSQSWTCFSTGESGGYGRIVSDCPELRRKLIAEGLAHVFVIDTTADAHDLALQEQAIKAKKGMWAKGAPEKIVTSLHSADENKKKGDSYNRLCSTQTGVANVEKHRNYYSLCEKVCIEQSCMTYIPFKKRYGKRKAICAEKLQAKN